jgi:AbrB family looped-hinge helix DNA binding protein
MATNRVTFTGTVSEKGWIVIPKELRDLLDIKKGSKVNMVYYGGGIFLEPEPEWVDPIADTEGMFEGQPSMLDTYMQGKREELAIEDAKDAYWGAVNRKKYGKLRT